MFVPALKLVLMIVGEMWRFSDDPFRRCVSYQAVRFVQVISKWACPDMFAYILMTYLLRDLDLRSDIISSAGFLDTGALCFSMFCIFSTLSSPAVKLPASGGWSGEAILVRPPFVATWFGSRGESLIIAG